MNEELKIILKAVTADAQKELSAAKKEIQGIKGASKEGSGALKALGGVCKGAAVAVGAVGAAVGATVTALVKLSSSTADSRKQIAQLNSAFQAAGSTTEQASKTYTDFYRFLGDADTATEASNLLVKLTQDEQELAEWTTALQGVYASFPDSLPIEGLVEASNETAKVGKVTGNLADALNWAGVSEDAFNASLAATSSEQERQTLIRNTLNGLYSDAAALYEKNAAEILAQNEAQARLDATMAQAGQAAAPLQTALTNISNVLMQLLMPAINFVVPYLVSFMNVIAQAVGWVSNFISALTGTKAAAGAVADVAKSMGGATSGMNKAASGAQGITSGLNEAAKAAEEVKRQTAGFDELNVMSSGSSGSSGASAGAGGAGGGGAGAGFGGTVGGFTLDTGGLTGAFDDVSGKADAFGTKVKSVFDGIKSAVTGWLGLFQPTVEAWGGAFDTIKLSWDGVKDNFANGGLLILESLGTLGGYLLEDFIPNVTNSFSENLAPVLGDVFGFYLTEAGLTFEWLGGVINNVVNDIITPALDLLKGIVTDAMESIGKAWDEHGGALMENISTALEGLRDTWDKFYESTVKPIVDIIIAWVQQIWDETLKPLWDKLVKAVLNITNNLAIFWNTILKPIVDWLVAVLAPIVKTVVNNILAVIRTIIDTVSAVIGGVIDFFDGLIQFIVGVFTGDWKKAWDGIKRAFQGIWNAIWGIVKGVVNLIIDGINMLWSGIYHAVKGIVDAIGGIAGAIGDLFGQDWHFSMPESPPLIPKLATGGVVTQETLARIGEGGKKEVVLPLEQNTGWADILAEKLNGGKGGAPIKLVLMVDKRELGYATIDGINGITEQTGVLPLVLA